MTDELKYRAFRAVNYTLKDLNSWRRAVTSALACEAHGAKWTALSSGCASSTEALIQLHKASLYASQVASTLNMLGHRPVSPDDLVGDIAAYVAVLRDAPVEEEKLRAARILRHSTWALDSVRRDILTDVDGEARGDPWKNAHFPTSPLAVKFYAQTVGIVAEAKAAYEPYNSRLYEPACEPLHADIDYYLGLN